MCRMAADGTLFVPKGDRVAIVKGDLGMEETEDGFW